LQNATLTAFRTNNFFVWFGENEKQDAFAGMKNINKPGGKFKSSAVGESDD
jgi:hypothetical protein